MKNEITNSNSSIHSPDNQQGNIKNLTD